MFEAAIRLFCEQGYAQVTMADIATDVGLARNSLYRYYPDKAHILLRWYRTELPRQSERSRALLAGDGPPVERIKRWADDQLDYAHQPEHRLIAALADAVPNLDADTRAELADSHDELFAPLDETLAEAGVGHASRSQRHHRSDRRARPQRSPTRGTPRPRSHRPRLRRRRHRRTAPPRPGALTSPRARVTRPERASRPHQERPSVGHHVVPTTSVTTGLRTPR